MYPKVYYSWERPKIGKNFHEKTLKTTETESGIRGEVLHEDIYLEHRSLYGSETWTLAKADQCVWIVRS